MNALSLVAGAAIGAAAFLVMRNANAQGGEATALDDWGGEGQGGDLFSDIAADLGDAGFPWLTDSITMTGVTGSASTWSPSKIPAQFVGAIAAAERSYGIPDNLLARLLWQESRYRSNAVSPAGARGIAQFMPGTAADFGIDPFDPYQSIDAAGRYLRQLYNATGSWRDALAAYNWGIGNLTRLGIGAAPAETRAYYSQILGDIGMA